MFSGPVRWLLRGGAVMCLTAGGLAVISGTSVAAQGNFGQATEVPTPPNIANLVVLVGVSCASATASPSATPGIGTR
jgi:hypothetical protein